MLIHPWSHLSLEFCLVVRACCHSLLANCVLHHPSPWRCRRCGCAIATLWRSRPQTRVSSFDLDSISDDNKALMEKIGGMTLMDAAALIKEVESTFNVGPKSDDGEGEAIEE